MKTKTDDLLRQEIVETLKLFRNYERMDNALIERETFVNTEGKMMIESDYDYYERLWKMVQRYGCFSSSDTTILLERILSKMYVARNITLDNNTMNEVLSDLDKYSRRWDDHNGETSEHRVRIQAWKTIRELKQKYL